MSNDKPELTGKRLLIVEEVLKDPVGHWYEYVAAVAELNRARGVETAVVAHATIAPAMAAELNVTGRFPRSSWDNVYYHPKAWRRYLGALRHNWLVFTTMDRVLRRHGRVDCLFAPTVALHHIWGWRLVLARHRSRIGRMVLLFRFNVAEYPDGSVTPRYARSSDVLKLGMRSFANALREGRAMFATDSKRLADEYVHFCGIRPEVFPSPRIAPFSDRERPPRAPDEPLVLSSLGPARFDKGIDLLQEAIVALLEEGPSRPVKFVIQWNHPIKGADGGEYLPDPRLVADAGVEFITRPLDSAAYGAALEASDAILLPYQRATYYARISGVAVEAVTAGIPALYTADTWNADLFEAHGAGVAWADGDRPGLLAGIRRLLADYAELRNRALSRREGARAAHSGGAFLARLWGRP